jgi:polyisoprenoid-binding protein YceI
MRYLALILFLGAATTSALPAADQTFQLDASHTKVQFTLGDVLHTVRGSFAAKPGTVHFDPDSGTASGLLVVDAASGNSGSGMRDRRMHEKILEAQKYPEVRFALDRIEGQVPAEGESKIRLHGVFTIHGGSHDLTIPADVEIRNGLVAAKLHFIVPYVAWGLRNPSTLFLRVDDQVKIDIEASGHLQ